MNYHIRYWWARLKNEFRQLTLQRIPEEGAVDEVMYGLKRDPMLRKLIEEHEAKMNDQGKKAEQP